MGPHPSLRIYRPWTVSGGEKETFSSIYFHLLIGYFHMVATVRKVSINRKRL